MLNKNTKRIDNYDEENKERGGKPLEKRKKRIARNAPQNDLTPKTLASKRCNNGPNVRPEKLVRVRRKARKSMYSLYRMKPPPNNKKRNVGK